MFLFKLALFVAYASRSGHTLQKRTSDAQLIFAFPDSLAGGYPEHTQPTPRTCSEPRMLMMAYYPDWATSSLPPEEINFALFDWIDFAFAVPDTDLVLTWDSADGPPLLRRLVTAAHSAGSKVKLSIGGWTGSKHFSSAVSSQANRKILADNVLATYNTYSLDGIDIDWEYPARDGAGGNEHNSHDTTNFLFFLQTLRATLPSTANITLAVLTTTFIDQEGHPSLDLSGFALVLDWVLIMNYDVWGSSSKPGPNAPLYDACGNSTQAEASAVAAYNSWTSAGFPACKLVLGLPSYGYISTSKADRLQTRKTAHSTTRKDHQDKHVKVVDPEGNSDRQVQFSELVKQGALVRVVSADDGAPSFPPGGGFERHWDVCSSTPFLKSSAAGQIITYDDPESLGLKAAFAREVSMLGVNLFDIHGDTRTWDLTNSIRGSLGLATHGPT